MNKCTNCNTEFEGKFCPECGTPVTEEPTAPADVTEMYEQWKKDSPVISRLYTWGCIRAIVFIIGIIPWLMFMAFGLTDLTFSCLLAAIIIIYLWYLVIEYVAINRQTKRIIENNLSFKDFLNKSYDESNKNIGLFCSCLLEGFYCLQKQDTLSKLKNHIIVTVFLIVLAIIISFVIVFNNIWLIVILKGLFGEAADIVINIFFYIVALVPLAIAILITILSNPLKEKTLKLWVESETQNS